MARKISPMAWMDNRIITDKEKYKEGALLYRNQVKRLYKLLPPLGECEGRLPVEFKDFFNTLLAVFNFAYTGQICDLSKLSEEAEDLFYDFMFTLKSSRTHKKNRDSRNRDNSQNPPQSNSDITPEMSNEF